MVTSKGIQHFAGGGSVLNFRSRGTDTVPAMLTPGEMVLTPAQQRRLLGGGGDQAPSNADVVQAINALRRDLPRAVAVATSAATLRKRRAA
jgi:hypothetical protein